MLILWNVLNSTLKFEHFIFDEHFIVLYRQCFQIHMVKSKFPSLKKYCITCIYIYITFYITCTPKLPNFFVNILLYLHVKINTLFYNFFFIYNVATHIPFSTHNRMLFIRRCHINISTPYSLLKQCNSLEFWWSQ